MGHNLREFGEHPDKVMLSEQIFKQSAHIFS